MQSGKTKLARTKDPFAKTFRHFSSENLLRLFAENSTDILWIQDTQTHEMLFVSPSFEILTGISVDNVLSTPSLWTDLIVEEDRKRVSGYFQSFLAGETDFDVEYQIKLPSNQIRWIHDRVIKSMSIDHNDYIVGIAQDITLKKIEEKNLFERENILNLITENTNDYIILIQNEQIIYYNKALDTGKGGEIRRNIASGILDAIAPEERNRIADIHRRRLRGEKVPEVFETKLITRQGERIQVEVHSKVVTYHDRPAVLSVIRDLTDRKAAEAEKLLSHQLVNSLPSGLFTYRFEEPDKLYLVSANPAAEKITGITEKDCLGKEFNELWPLAKDYGITAKYINAAKTGKAFTQNEEFYDDGRMKGYFSTHVFPMPGNQVAVVFTDVTKQHEANDALHESEERFRNLMDSSPDTITIWNKDLELIDMSGSGLKRQSPGIGLNDILGQKLVDIASPENYQRWLRVVETGVPDTAYDTLQFPGRKPMHLAVRFFPMGENYAAIGTDITDQVEAEQALLRSERWFRGLLQGITDAVFVHRLNADGSLGPFLEVNDVACERLGYTREEMLGLSVYDIDDPQYATPLSGIMEALQKEGRAIFEQVHRTKNGGRIPVEVSSSLVQHEDTTLIISIIRDITQRVKAEEELRKLAAALNQSAEAVIIADTKGIIEYVNEAVVRISGYYRDELIGQPTRILESGAHPQEFWDEMMTTVNSGQVWEHRITGKAKDGSLFHEYAVITPIRDNEGNIVGHIASKRDITRELELEKELAHAQKMETVGNLTGGIAHDFNNLLTVISGNVDLLLLSQDDVDLRGELAEIGNIAERASQLTRQLLSFSRKRSSHPITLCLNDVLNGSEKLLRRTLGEHIQLVSDKQDGLWSHNMDPVQLEQILVNLAVNARDAMHDGGTLTLRTRNIPAAAAKKDPSSELNGDHVLLEVQDTGTGIDAETVEHIFEPFFTTKEAGKGTGLGLATVSSIVKHSNGAISLKSELGVGTTFQLRFPRVKVEADKVQTPAEAMSCLEGTETIMLVEDDQLVRRSTARSLNRYGYTVLEYDSAKNALDELNSMKQAPDLIVTDVVMPQMNGNDFVIALRDIKCKAPIVFMSGYSFDADKTSELIAGGIPFISKPFKPTDFITLIRDTLDGKLDN
ncbi:PAS domain S-box protein [bacterium]|nr:PAS domain S-box protein [bacterium]